jgi:hypothetical protein
MWRGVMQAVRSAEFIEPAAGREGYVIESAPGHPGLLALARPRRDHPRTGRAWRSSRLETST